MVNLNGEDWNERIHRTNHIYLHLTRLKAGKSTQRGFFLFTRQSEIAKVTFDEMQKGGVQM